MNIINGQPIQLKKDMLMHDVCCNCGLTHFKWIDDSWVMKTYRDDWETRRRYDYKTREKRKKLRRKK